MSAAQARVADAMLRSLGGRTVLLHIPAPAVAGDLGEQVGLATPLFQDLSIGPAVFRKIRPWVAIHAKERAADSELLLSATAVTQVVGSSGYRSADVLFANASAVVVDGAMLEIMSVASVEAFGSVYLYRLGLRAAAADLT